jgi:hypothetical protein
VLFFKVNGNGHGKKASLPAGPPSVSARARLSGGGEFHHPAAGTREKNDDAKLAIASAPTDAGDAEDGEYERF